MYDLWTIGVLPILAAGALAGFLGLYWDISWHIDKGRDTFFTPPHDFIYAGLLTVLVAALYGLWRDRRDTPLHVRWGVYRLHSGVLIVAAGAALVLVFAPLDDLWHRMFGVDVTLWGPMHLVGILGLAVGRFGGLVCAWLERGLTRDPGRRRLFGDLAIYFAALLLAGGVVVTGEYEFMVPQFPLIFHPVLLAGLPVFPLVLIARLAPRPYSATLATVAFTILRLALSGWLIATSHLELAGFSRPAIPLLILTGLAVDLLAARRTPGWLSGAAAGTVTLAANLLLIDAPARAAGGIRLFWPAGMFVASLVPALALSALMGATGAAAAASLGAPPEPARAPARSRPARGLAALLVAGALTAAAALSPRSASAAPAGPVASGEITITHRGPDRPSLVTIHVNPPGAPRGGELLLSIYRPGVTVNRRVLEPAAPGVYRIEYPFPADGAWRYYMRFGPGQAGFASAGYIGITNQAGGVDQAHAVFRSGLRRAPAYVQPLGYAAFGLIAALAIAGITVVLARMRLVYSASVPER